MFDEIMFDDIRAVIWKFNIHVEGLNSSERVLVFAGV